MRCGLLGAKAVAFTSFPPSGSPTHERDMKPNRSTTRREGEWAVALMNRDTQKRFTIPARTSGHYAMKDIRLSGSDSAWFYSQTC